MNRNNKSNHTMNVSRKVTLALATGASILMASCSLKQMTKLAEEQELTVNPSPLELHGDSVTFDMSATLPVNMLKKNKVYTLKTWYEYGDPTQELDQFTFSDVEFPNQKVEQPNLSKKFSFPYEEGMEEGTLNIQGIASNVAKTKSEETAVFPVAKGLITTSRLFKSTANAVIADHGYNNQEELETHSVEFFFEQGSAKLRGSETKGEQGQILTAFIASKNETRTVTITGSHSPEGSESANSKLSEERAKVIKAFYESKMKEYDYKGLADSIKFETKVVFQDWKGLKKALSSSSLSSEEQKQVSSIINGAGSYQEKSKKIEKLSFYKSVILKEIYPQLRTSFTEVLSVKPKKTDAEISVLAKAIYEGTMDASELSYEELMYAATLTPLLEEKRKIYEAATKSNDSWKSHNNLGAVYVMLAKKSTSSSTIEDYLTKAKDQFSLAVNKEENATTLANLMGAQLALGDLKDAEETIKKADKAGSSNTATASAISNTKGIIAIRKGNYDSAIKYLSNATDAESVKYNLGLAYLLKKNYTKAATTLEEATYENDKDAYAYYLRAVTAARSGNEAVLGVMLQKAVSLDSDLKAKALTDLEFASYFESEAFLNALN